VAEDPRGLGDDLLAREVLQGDALDDRRALGLGQQRPQRVAAVELVGAIGGDEQDARLPSASVSASLFTLRRAPMIGA
jgi:hypothetical protein